jgi:hypothetical protein
MEIKKKPEIKYNPLNLPKAIDFNLASTKVPLSRETKTRYQIMLSKMNRKELKRVIEYWHDMRYTALNRNLYKEAANCEAFREFTEAYFNSVKIQNRV